MPSGGMSQLSNLSTEEQIKFSNLLLKLRLLDFVSLTSNYKTMIRVARVLSRTNLSAKNQIEDEIHIVEEYFNLSIEEMQNFILSGLSQRDVGGAIYSRGDIEKSLEDLSIFCLSVAIDELDKLSSVDMRKLKEDNL